MLIKSVKLENIRSYTNENIEFPEGSVLLSGDIGCGKSTILSAIEFALFGIKRKELSGNALLRHGKNNGSVELNFEIDNKNIIIKRTLKRSKEDVKQDTGYIITDNLKQEATAVELKTKILELLGFPKDLVSKTKDLVYRYTVYTPQEEMKQILIGDVESRLDTLRRVFGIDKYKRIKANTFIITRQLKEKINLFQGQIEDLEEKQDNKKQHKEQIREIEERISVLLPNLKEIKEKLILKKEETSSIEKNIQELNQLKNKLSVNESDLKNKQSQFKSNDEQILSIKRELNNLQREVGTEEIPNTEFISKTTLNIPLHQSLSNENVAKIIKLIKKFTSKTI